MTLSEILEVEKRNDEDDLYKIHLFLENDWWRAYEWSAWLCRNYPNSLDESNKLKPTHKSLENVENGLILVGLKLNHFDKYMPKAKVISVNDRHIIVDTKEVLSNLDFNSYKPILNKWKDNTPLRQEEPKNRKEKPLQTSQISLTSIMREILAYPLESRTPIENMEFIRDIKNKVLKLI